MSIDIAKLRARGADVLVTMSDRRALQRKCLVADEFDAFMLSASGQRRYWKQAPDRRVFDYLCYLDTQDGGITLVHDRDCPGVGMKDSSHQCPPGSGCAK